MIVRTAKALEEHFQELGPGDTVVGPVGYGPPAARAAAGSAGTGRGLHPLGPVPGPHPFQGRPGRAARRVHASPHTLAIRRRKDLLNAITTYGRAGIGAVISKQEHLHCGHGVRRWEHIEALYSHCGLDENAFPFVLQPFVADFQDVRVILIGDYEEAYVRHNPHSFRGNLSAGGSATHHGLTPDQRAFCHDVMQRARFPYAHIDLQLMADGTCYLLEIALNGGIHGSRLQRTEIEALKSARLAQLIGDPQKQSIAGSAD